MSYTLRSLRPKKLVPRTDFDMLEFRKQIFTHGLNVSWAQALRCPCNAKLGMTGTGAFEDFTGKAQPECGECKGTGLLYHSTQTILAQVTGAQEIPKVRDLYGEWTVGLVRITMQPEHRPSVWDRFTVIDAIDVNFERRTRTSSVTERPTYPIVKRTHTLGTLADDTEPETLTVGVLYLALTDATGTIKVDGSGNPVELVEGTDFDVTAAGLIDWTKGITSGKAPLAGAFYSLRYYCRPVYIAQNIPFVHRTTIVQVKYPTAQLSDMPSRVDCWREGFPGPQTT